MKKLILLAALGSILAGCGGSSSDPTQKYKSATAKDIPTATKNDVKQQFSECGVAIDTDPTMEVIEGTSGSHAVVLKGLYGPTRDSISVVSTSNEEVPASAIRLNRVRTSNNGVEYTLSYSAPKGFIPRDNDIRTFNVTLSPTSVLKAGNSCPTQVGVVVKRTKAAVSIAELKYKKTVSYESLADQTISVDVSAGQSKASDLSLNIDYDDSASSKEQPVYDMSAAIVRVSSAKAAGSGKFSFKLKLDAEILGVLVKRQVEANKSKRSFLMLASISVLNKETNVSANAPQNIVVEVTRQSSEAELAKDQADREQAQKDADARAKAKADAAATAAAKASADATAAAATPAKVTTPVADEATTKAAVKTPAKKSSTKVAVKTKTVAKPVVAPVATTTTSTLNQSQAATAAGAKK